MVGLLLSLCIVYWFRKINLIYLCERELNWLDMVINCQKACCLRIGPRCDAACAKITTLAGHILPWTREIRYPGVFVAQSGVF